MAASKNEPGFLEKLGLAVSSVGLEGVVKNAPAFLIPGVLDNIASREKSRQQLASVQAAADLSRLVGSLFGQDDNLSAKQQMQNLPVTQGILEDAIGPEQANTRIISELMNLEQQGGQNRLARAQARRALVASGVDPETARKQTKGQGYDTLQGVVQGDLAEAPKRGTAAFRAELERGNATYKFGLDQALTRYKADVEVDKTTRIKQAERDAAIAYANSDADSMELALLRSPLTASQMDRVATTRAMAAADRLESLRDVRDEVYSNEALYDKPDATDIAIRKAEKALASGDPIQIIASQERLNKLAAKKPDGMTVMSLPDGTMMMSTNAEAASTFDEVSNRKISEEARASTEAKTLATNLIEELDKPGASIGLIADLRRAFQDGKAVIESMAGAYGGKDKEYTPEQMQGIVEGALFDAELSAVPAQLMTLAYLDATSFESGRLSVSDIEQALIRIIGGNDMWQNDKRAKAALKKAINRYDRKIKTAEDYAANRPTPPPSLYQRTFGQRAQGQSTPEDAVNNAIENMTPEQAQRIQDGEDPLVVLGIQVDGNSK